MALIKGRVRYANGDPVSGATVFVKSGPQQFQDIAQLTGADGEFTLSVTGAGVYVVGAHSDENSAQTTVQVTSDVAEAEIILGAQ